MPAEAIERVVAEVVGEKPIDDGHEHNQLAVALTRGLEPIEWAPFWAEEAPPEEWFAEPILPAGRGVAVFSPAKEGKSLLALDIAAAKASGRAVLGRPAGPPVSVLYLDLEMTEADLRERLVDLGYGPDDDLSRLAYYQLPSLPPLDTDRGGQVVEALAKRHGAEAVLIDTMARAVKGGEDSADTYRDFYMATGIRLKRMAVALLRLDHAGKDPAKGQRGSSSKADDVDVVFRLSVVEDRVLLTRTHTRIPWVPAEVSLRREVDPELRHVLTDGGWPAGTAEVSRLLDELEVPLDSTVTATVRTLKLAKSSRRRQLVAAGLRFRRERANTSKTVPVNLGTVPGTTVPERLGTVSESRTKRQASRRQTVPGTAGNRPASEAGTPFPSLEGTGPDTDPEASRTHQHRHGASGPNGP